MSSDPSPHLYIALEWAAVNDAVSYDIYRKNDGDIAYPATPLNNKPIMMSGNCNSIKAFLIKGSDSTAWKMLSQGLSDSVLFNPCNIHTLNASSVKYERLLTLARGNLSIAEAAGVGYEDYTVTSGKIYYYEIVASIHHAPRSGLRDEKVAVVTDLKVTAGVPTILPAPTDIIAEAGDAKIQVRWSQVKGAGGYIVERSSSPGGAYLRVNTSGFITMVNNHLNGDTLVPASEGFVDAQQYTSTGKAIMHNVLGNMIAGPINGNTYYYRIRTLDFFGQPGQPSAISNPVKPKDSTPPAVPINLVAVPDDVDGFVDLRWTQDSIDMKGHYEQYPGAVKYKIYRFKTSTGNPDVIPSTLVASVAQAPARITNEFIDKDPNLRSKTGNKTWWYRIKGVDSAGNIGSWSGAVSAIVKDTTPPAIVQTLSTVGLTDHVDLSWELNTETDMASYMVYRSLCHLGQWVPCTRKDYDAESPCCGPFVFLGSITQDSAIHAAKLGHAFFSDYTIPTASPLCYSYWIKAKDQSGNESGSFPFPSNAELPQIQCQRLHDTTPPEPALISNLSAVDNGIRVEWVGPPTQDTRAYQVYRADGTNPANEPAISTYKWVGGITVAFPPGHSQILKVPYTPPLDASTCANIPVLAVDSMSIGSFTDRTALAKKTYWYRVVAVDYDGNQTDLGKAAAISTFTFTTKREAAPVLESLSPQSNPCGVLLQWLPAYNSMAQAGFIIYRSISQTGSLTQVNPIPVQGNTFVDAHVDKGTTYWYSIGILSLNGRLSELSKPQSVTP